MEKLAKNIDLRPWLTLRFGKNIEKHGDEWAIPCLTCDVHRTKEFRLWFQVKRNVGVCYKCGTSYKPLRLIQAFEGVNLAEAMRLLKEHTVGGVLSLANLKAHVERALSDAPEEKVEPLPVCELPEEFTAAADTKPSRWPPYLMERIGSRKSIIENNVGWCDSGYWRDRLIIPVTMAGRVLSFIARDMTGKAEKKVLYPKGTKTSRMLFNYDRASKCESPILVEGVLDALRVGPRGMAIFGTSLSEAQVALLTSSRAREVVVMLDGDEAGEAGNQKLAARLRTLFRVRVARLGRGRDPNDYDRASLLARADGAPLVGSKDLAAHVRAKLGRS